MTHRASRREVRRSVVATCRSSCKTRLARAAVAVCAALASQAGFGQPINSQWNTGNGAWNIATNWAPQDVPDNFSTFTYDVQIGNLPVAAGAQASFVPEDGTSDTISSLVISSAADLLTLGNQLIVLGQTTLDGAGSTIRVDAHATPGVAAFNTDNLDLNNGGGLTLEGGLATIDVLLEISSGTVGGHGTLNVGDADGVVEIALENSSLIQPSSNSAAPQTMTLHSNGVDTIDLDGTTETGLVDVSNALANVNADTVTLVVDGPLSDAFSGTLQIGQRDTVTFNDNFTMSGADVQMNGGTQVATLNGAGDVTNIASSAFTITGDAAIANNMTFTGPGNTVTVNASSSLTLAGTVTSGDASWLVLGGAAELIVTGSLTVIEAGGDIDWDGTSNNATTTIAGTGLLSLTVDQVDVGNNIYNGTINLNDNGDLTVNNTISSWQAAGNVNKNGVGTSSISGDEFAVTGNLNVNAGTLSVSADAIFGSTSDVVIASGATALMGTTQVFTGADITVNGTLSLGAASVLEAPATLTGTGMFRLGSTSTVIANTVVNTTTFDWDGTGGNTHTINDGVIFTINSTVFDTDGDMDDQINLGGNGAQIIVNGVGSWTMARTLNANTAAAGLASIGGTSQLRFSGALAVLNVDGNTNINAPVVFGASSTVSIDTGMTLNLAGSGTYEGGTIGGAGSFSPATGNFVTASSTIDATNFDFDAGNWTISNQALLTINVTDYDILVSPNAFDSTINLNDGDISVTTADAEFVMDGALNMSSTVNGQIVAWTGEPFDLGNDAGSLDADLNVTGTQQSQFGSLVDFNSDADVNVAAGATLNLLSAVSFDTVNAASNAEFTGPGTMSFSGPVNVNEAVTLNMVGGTVDLDGLDNAGDFVNIDAPMTINAATMANFGRANGGGGVNTLDVNNSVGTGVLTVNLDSPTAEWTLNGPGVMNLVNDNTQAVLLAGSDVNINGTVNVTGDVQIDARMDIAGIINLNTAAEPLRLNGGNNSSDPNTIAGATITGVGVLGANTGKALHGFGTINTTIDFDGASNLLASGGTLHVSGAVVDVGTIGTASGTGILNMVGAWNTNVATVVRLAGGELRGGTVTNDLAAGIAGNGLLASRVINNTRLRADTGTLIVQTAANDNDWDGAGNTGSLNAANAGVLEARDNATFGFLGNVTATGGSRVFTNGFALDFNPGSTLVLGSSTYESASSTDLGGTVTVNAGPVSTIKVANNFFLTFETGSNTTLNGNLSVVNNNINIEAGAAFSGPGALVIPDGSHMVADNLADVGVLLQMQGAFRPGNFNGIGRVGLFDYQQDATGELYVELTGTALNAFDRLVASGDVVLDGYLNIDIDEVSPGVPFVPVLGQTFNIITGNTLTGAFDYKDVSGMPAGLTFHVEYLSNAVQLQVVTTPFFAADFDDDGDVDMTDLAIWEGAFNLNQLGDANGDNKTDIDDWTIWRDQFGAAPGSFLGSSVPEPAGGLLVALGSMLGALRRRVRRSAVAIAALVIGVAGMNSTASAMPTLTVANGGLSGPNRLWHVQVAPDPALFSGGQGSVAVELSLELTVGQLVNVTKNAAAWPFDLPTNRDPFGLPNDDGLVFSLATDKVFAALGSNLFASGTPVTVLTLETLGSSTTTVHWGGQSVGSLQLSRIAQGGVAFNGYQGTLTLGGLPGDFDFDGDLDAIDIDMLFDAVQGVVPPAIAIYDLNNNGSVNSIPNSANSDADVWVRNLKGTEYGDANLDGKVDINDLATLATNWQGSGGWALGDSNGDGSIDINDLAALATNWQFGVPGPPLAMSFEHALASVGLGGVAVPEPGLLALLPALLLIRRRMP